MASKFLDSNGVLYLWGKIKAILPTKLSDLSNDAGFITSSDIPEGAAASTTAPKMDGVANVGSEMAFARGDHVHPSDTSKVDKVDGMGLSSNDFTTAEKTKLSGIEEKANNYVLPVATASVMGGVKIGSNINISSGTISVSGGSLTAAGVLKLTDGVTSNDTATAATPKSVKMAYDLANSKQSPATTLAGYGITDAYTKSEVDGKISGAFHYKGTKANYADLPTANNVIGDVWNIANADKTHNIKAGDNVVWNGSAWDNSSGLVDLSNYVTFDNIISNAEIDEIVAS